MQKFQFNLEKVLELRLYHEREAEIKLGQITGRCNALHRSIEETRRKKKDVFRKRSLRGGDLSSFLWVEQFSQRMDKEIEELRFELEKAEKERLQAQEEFLELSKKRKILDKLKDREKQKYYREQKKVEQKNLDEVSSAMHIRGMEEKE